MKEKSTAVYRMKGLAILSVICAHCNSILYGSTWFAEISSKVLQNIGTAGVICFFVISGYLFHPVFSNKMGFFMKKIIKIDVPWVISGTLVYLYVYLRKPPMSYLSWINFLIGNGSYYYYLTMLMLLYLLFCCIPILSRKWLLLCLAAVTLVTSFCYRGMNWISPYLNVINWIGYFAIGVSLQKYGQRVGMFFKHHIHIKWLISIYAALLCYQLYYGKGGWYWGGSNALVSWIGALALAKTDLCMGNADHRILEAIGKDSFFIYIWHMPLAGITARVMSIGILVNLMLLRPLLVLAVVECSCTMIKRIIKKCGLQRYAFAIGIS